MRLLNTISALYYVKVRRRQRDLSICQADQHTSPVHQGWQNRAHTVQQITSFVNFVHSSSDLFRSVNASPSSTYTYKLSITMSHPVLFPISLRSTTTSHTICSLLCTVSQDTPVMKPRSITLFDHNRLLRNSISNNTQQCLVQR